MKYILILILGIGLGISGEFFIPKSLQYPMAYGCIKSKFNKNLTFLTSVDIFNYDRPKDGKVTLITKETIPSYLFLANYLLGDLKILNREDCNSIIKHALDNG